MTPADDAVDQKRIDAFVARVRKVARECGYAVGVHGSQKRDLDLIAVPWTRNAVGGDQLVDALIEHVPLALRTPEQAGIPSRHYDNPEDRPHGRRSWALHGCPVCLYVDLAVFRTVRW